MRKVKFGLVISFLFMMLLLGACVGKGGTDETNSDGVKEITIGFTGPLSGPAAFYGKETLNGITMAAKHINDEGGFKVDGQKYKIKISSLDDQYLPNEAAANAKRLVQEEKANVVYTPHSGGVYAMQVFNELEDFIIMGYTSDPWVTDQGNSLSVRIPPRYDNYLEPFTKYEMDRYGKRIAFLPTSSQYGKDWAEALRPVWEEHGGEIVFDESIDFSKDTDFQTIMVNALNTDPDVLFIGGPSEPTALVLKQARDLGFEGGFLIMEQAKMDEMANVLGEGFDLLEGSIATPPLIYSEFPGTESYIEEYRETYDRDPGSESGYHYVSLYTLIEAMKVAGTVEDTKEIMAAMDEGAKNVPEERQVYTILGVDENGGFNHAVRIAYIEDSEVQLQVVE